MENIHKEWESRRQTNVGVVDLGQEADFGWRHGVFFGQEELELENTVWDVTKHGRE